MKRNYFIFLFFIIIYATAFVQSPFLSLEKNVVFDSAENKTLILMRHAKSSHDQSNQSDFDRPLDAKGEKEAAEMGKQLIRSHQQIDLIIASPSKRTTQTAAIVCKVINYDTSKIKWDSTIYRCTNEALVDVIKTMDNQYKTILIIGHNPAITYVANAFQKDLHIDEVPTSGIVAIGFSVSAWCDVTNQNGKLIFYKYPK